MNPYRTTIEKPLTQKQYPFTAIAVGAFIGLAALISAESLRKTREVCPEILQACKTNEVDEHGDPHWPLSHEEFKCINEKLRKIQDDITFVLVADCAQ